MIKEYKIIENGIELNVKVFKYAKDFYYKDELYRIEYNSGEQRWFKYGYGKLHRENGPAVILADGTEQYWLNGKYYKNITSVDELIIASIII